MKIKQISSIKLEPDSKKEPSYKLYANHLQLCEYWIKNLKFDEDYISCLQRYRYIKRRHLHFKDLVRQIQKSMNVVKKWKSSSFEQMIKNNEKEEKIEWTGDLLCKELVKRGLKDPRLNLSYPENPVHYEVTWHNRNKHDFSIPLGNSVLTFNESPLTYRMSDEEYHFASRYTMLTENRLRDTARSTPWLTKKDRSKIRSCVVSPNKFASQLQTLYLLNGPPALNKEFCGDRSCLPERTFMDARNLCSRPKSVQFLYTNQDEVEMNEELISKWQLII